jgi:hypothetical protein
MDENTAPGGSIFTQHQLHGRAAAQLRKPNTHSKETRFSALENVCSSGSLLVQGRQSPSAFRQPLVSISSNLPHLHLSNKKTSQASGKAYQDIPAVTYGPLASAILTRKQQRQSTLQRSAHQHYGPGLSGTNTLSCSVPQHATAHQPGHLTSRAAGLFVHTPMQKSSCGAMATADPAWTTDPQGDPTMLPETVTTMHAVPELASRRLQTPSTAVLRSSTPGSSEALQRLQQQQQLRWQQQQASRMAQHGKVPVAPPPPFSRHPAVSILTGELLSLLKQRGHVLHDVRTLPTNTPCAPLHNEQSAAVRFPAIVQALPQQNAVMHCIVRLQSARPACPQRRSKVQQGTAATCRTG